jgi:hypothetical protein
LPHPTTVFVYAGAFGKEGKVKDLYDSVRGEIKVIGVTAGRDFASVSNLISFRDVTDQNEVGESVSIMFMPYVQKHGFAYNSDSLFRADG